MRGHRPHSNVFYETLMKILLRSADVCTGCRYLSHMKFAAVPRHLLPAFPNLVYLCVVCRVLTCPRLGGIESLMESSFHGDPVGVV